MKDYGGAWQARFDWLFWLTVKENWPDWSRQPAWHPSETPDPTVWRAEDD